MRRTPWILLALLAAYHALVWRESLRILEEESERWHAYLDKQTAGVSS